MGVVLTTYKSWDDPPSRPIALYNLRYDDAPLRNPGFAQVLEQVNKTSRSVRVMKRLLEHQPSKDPEARASHRSWTFRAWFIRRRCPRKTMEMWENGGLSQLVKRGTVE